MDLKKAVRTIPDFPQPGIQFRDITTVLKDPTALRFSLDSMKETLRDIPHDFILGPESRGFMFGMPLAYCLNKGFIPVRKAGKLPAAVIKKDYSLEYGTATIEMHRDAISPGQRIVVVDDLLATGGTAKAIAELVEEMGGEVSAYVFFIELTALNGRGVLGGYPVYSVLEY
jgi:adenine phosphoribosyltransferase